MLATYRSFRASWTELGMLATYGQKLGGLLDRAWGCALGTYGFCGLGLYLVVPHAGIGVMLTQSCRV